MASDRLERVLRSLEKRGLALDNRALALVRAHYRDLKLGNLVELIETVAVLDSRAQRLGQLPALMQLFDELVRVLGEPPPGTRALLTSAAQLGMQATTELIDAQGEGLYYDLPATREIEYVQKSSARLDSYWGTAQAAFRADVQDVLTTGFERAQAPSDIVTALSRRTLVSRSRAALIVRNETGTVQGWAMEQDQRDMGYTRYTWSTARDSRVRPEHQAREGKVFEWDHPPDDGPPGVPILCRCVAIPVVS